MSSRSVAVEEKVKVHRDLHSAVVVNPVDLASDEHADLAVLPPLLVDQQVGDQQSQAWSEDKQRQRQTGYPFLLGLGLHLGHVTFSLQLQKCHF